MKFTGYVAYDIRSNLEHFDDVAYNPLKTAFLKICGSLSVSNMMEGEWIFEKNSGYAGYDTRNN